MFFKRKCPTCGAKNPKERTTCAECGVPLDSGQVVVHGRKSPDVEMQRSPEYGYPTETASRTGATMKCPRCKQQNEPVGNFCIFCGSQLEDKGVGEG